MELEVVYNSSFKYYKVFSLKMKNIQKEASHLKIKIFDITKDTRKTMKIESEN